MYLTRSSNLSTFARYRYSILRRRYFDVDFAPIWPKIVPKFNRVSRVQLPIYFFSIFLFTLKIR